jgi:hypothetical protein
MSKNPSDTTPATSSSGSPAPVSASVALRTATMCSNDVPCVRQSAKLGQEVMSSSMPCRGLVSQTVLSPPGSGNGSGLSSTPRTTLKTAVVAPTPRASVSSVVAAKPGLRPSERRPKRRSRAVSSTHAVPRTSRDWVLKRSTPPKAR